MTRTTQRTGLPRRQNFFLAGLLCGSLLVGAAGIVASHYIKSPAQAAADTAPPVRSRVTVAVEKRVLEKTVISRGTVGASRSVDITAASGQDAQRLILTALRVRVGQSVREGQVVAEVSGRPVIVLRGAIPAYRDLRPGSSGPDVRQLQAALSATGYATQPDESGFYGSGTKAALSALYQRTGYTAATAAEDEEERLSSARLQVRRAQRTLADARRQQQGTQVSPAAAPTGQPNSTGTGASSDVADARDALDVALQDLYRLERSTGPMLPIGEAVFIPAFPARVDRVTGTVGTQPRGSILSLSTGELIVRGQILPSERALIRRGLKVKIASEATGLTATGVIDTVGQMSAASTSGDNATDNGNAAGGNQSNNQVPASDSGAEGFPVEIRGTTRLDPRLNGQDVRLIIVAASTVREVTVVPLAAVTARADGSTQVVRVSGDGTEDYVPVTAGTSGDGYVQVTPVSGPLDAGDLVVVGK